MDDVGASGRWYKGHVHETVREDRRQDSREVWVMEVRGDHLYSVYIFGDPGDNGRFYKQTKSVGVHPKTVG